MTTPADTATPLLYAKLEETLGLIRQHDAEADAADAANPFDRKTMAFGTEARRVHDERKSRENARRRQLTDVLESVLKALDVTPLVQAVLDEHADSNRYNYPLDFSRIKRAVAGKLAVANWEEHLGRPVRRALDTFKASGYVTEMTVSEAQRAGWSRSHGTQQKHYVYITFYQQERLDTERSEAVQASKARLAYRRLVDERAEALRVPIVEWTRDNSFVVLKPEVLASLLEQVK